ncbi:MAG: trehalose-6-phosphate synthase [Elusimicrobiota bacterium]|nr:MAG: trehalose-6-phosphate synthase [Elusimicrobiota bacterium]
MTDYQAVFVTAATLLAAALAARLVLRRQTDRLLARNAALARELERAKESAELEARLREHGDSLWTPERLREHVRVKLSGRPLVVVSNREPYRHVARGLRTEWVTPASGLVTGLEPLLRACGGTWIAHGDGDRDRETADERGRLRVPPDLPQYSLRRVWLGDDEVAGHYSGFSNEGLWPLCHIAHVRPEFRPSDWAFYKSVNEKFADAVLDEIGSQEEPCVLVQDYHFALLPKLIKERRPDARVAIFWHIPWPNPEAFAICPWAKDLLEGMLGADVAGFHTQHICNNFLDSVDRLLESRVNRARFSVKRGDRETLVRPFPISVALPEGPEATEADARAARARVLKAAGIAPEFIAVGVDRLDYTKGIIERFRAVERLLETSPELRGRFTLFQIGAPSREALAGYRDFTAAVTAEAARVNARFGGGAPAIALLARHHTQAEILPYFLAADVMLVTSLHDGMNLVAKEFCAARADGGGVLVLSRFTGAARELRDALIVNPYDADGVAAAIKTALAMPPPGAPSACSACAGRCANATSTVGRPSSSPSWPPCASPSAPETLS